MPPKKQRATQFYETSISVKSCSGIHHCPHDWVKIFRVAYMSDQVKFLRMDTTVGEMREFPANTSPEYKKTQTPHVEYTFHFSYAKGQSPRIILSRTIISLVSDKEHEEQSRLTRELLGSKPAVFMSYEMDSKGIMRPSHGE